jgi:large subunit ribosomal protein L33
MARNEIRPLVKLRSTVGTGYTYVTRKNRRNNPDRLVLRNTTRSSDATSTSERSAEHGSESKIVKE